MCRRTVRGALQAALLACCAWWLPGVSMGADLVVVESQGWRLHGDLELPETSGRVPAVLMLNRAAGNRKAYEPLADELARRGIASLRLDLRGHGDSTNLGKFVPYESTAEEREVLIWSSDEDVVSAYNFLAAHPSINPKRIAVVGGSYSGEEMAEAGRNSTRAAAYVALSPGSFSDESIADMDPSGVPWLFVVARSERHLAEIAAAVQADTRLVEIIYVPGNKHATGILEARPDLSERIAVWLTAVLTR